MIKLIFSSGRETFTIEIENKNIVYKDRKYPKGFNFIPSDKDFKRIVIFSRNKLPMNVIQWVESANRGRGLEQWKLAKDSEALVPIIIHDSKINGCVFQQRINIK